MFTRRHKFCFPLSKNDANIAKSFYFLIFAVFWISYKRLLIVERVRNRRGRKREKRETRKTDRDDAIKKKKKVGDCRLKKRPDLDRKNRSSEVFYFPPRKPPGNPSPLLFPSFLFSSLLFFSSFSLNEREEWEREKIGNPSLFLFLPFLPCCCSSCLPSSMW